MAETKSISVQEGEGRKNENPLISILSSIQNFKFPQLPQFNKPQITKEVSSSAASPSSSSEVRENKTVQKPDIVKVGDPKKEFPALTLEGDESQEPSGPSNMWQVYALGGFIIAKWLWGRWNERKANKKSDDKQDDAGDDNASATPSTSTEN